jgi:hypothetical protein
MLKGKIIICLIVTIIVLSISCNSRKNQDDIIGKSICCDSLLLIKGKKCVDGVNTSSNGFSVILWIDSTKCIPCEMNYLYGYESFNNRCEKILGYAGCMKVIISLGKSYNIDMIVYELSDQNYSFDILLDSNNKYNSFFNCNNRILIIEHDGIILDYYHLDNKKRDQRTANDCLNKLEQLSMAQQ